MQWWTAQHPLRRVVVDQEGQIGPPAGNQYGMKISRARDPDGMQVAVQCDQVEPVE